MSVLKPASSKTLTDFSYRLGLFMGTLERSFEDAALVDWFTERDVAYESWDELRELLKPFAEALYK